MKTGDLFDGRFRLRDRLGVGGMSVVWRAHDEVLGRDVAVKVLSADLARDPALLARIRDEARAVARLRHPNIVDVYDFGEAPGPLPYVVMEVVEGRSLSELLTGGPLPWHLAALVGAQVSAALAAAHDRGVVHRDVKPGNVVVSGARVKLVDFGISAVSGDDDRAAGQLLGTPAYLAPERLEQGVVRPATDVYALGLILYRALAGQMPWQVSTATQMLRAHRYREPEPLPRIAGLPSEVATLCRQCLEKDPARRPSAAAAATVLAAAAGVDLAVLALPGSTDLSAKQNRSSWQGRPNRPYRPSRPIRSRPASTQPIRARLRVARPAAATQAIAVRFRKLGGSGTRRLAVAAGAAATLVSGLVLAATLPGGLGGPQAQARTQTQALADPPPVDPVRVAAPAPECTVGYVVAAGAGRFTTKVSVTNTGKVAIPAAPLSFTLPGRQWLRSGAPGTWRQNGRTITAGIAELAPGSKREATLRGTYQGVSALPDTFELDGTTCQVTLSVAAAAPARAGAEPRKAADKPAANKADKPKPAKKVKEKPKWHGDDDEDDEGDDED